MANTFHINHFRSPKSLSYIVYGLVAVQIFAFVVGVITSLGVLVSPDWIIDLDDGESTPVFVFFLGLSALLRIGALIFTIIFFLIWEYRAYSNLSPLKARNLEHSPGWAVGWWFIPFANLVKPFQVMKEIWVESDPDYSEDLGFLSSNSSAPAIFGFWWGLWIVGNIVLRISDSQFDKATTNFTMPAYLYLVGSSAAIIAAALLILIVKDITERQIQRNRRLESSGFWTNEPPPPPIFGRENR
jgi:hypothetical protein